MNEADQTMSNSSAAGGDSGASPDATTSTPARRHGPDLITLAAGLGSLAVAGSALMGRAAWLPGMDLRWMVAAAAILIGLLLVIGGVRPRRS